MSTTRQINSGLRSGFNFEAEGFSLSRFSPMETISELESTQLMTRSLMTSSQVELEQDSATLQTIGSPGNETCLESLETFLVYSRSPGERTVLNRLDGMSEEARAVFALCTSGCINNRILQQAGTLIEQQNLGTVGNTRAFAERLLSMVEESVETGKVKRENLDTNIVGMLFSSQAAKLLRDIEQQNSTNPEYKDVDFKGMRMAAAQLNLVTQMYNDIILFNQYTGISRQQFTLEEEKGQPSSIEKIMHEFGMASQYDPNAVRAIFIAIDALLLDKTALLRLMKEGDIQWHLHGTESSFPREFREMQATPSLASTLNRMLLRKQKYTNEKHETMIEALTAELNWVFTYLLDQDYAKAYIALEEYKGLAARSGVFYRQIIDSSKAYLASSRLKVELAEYVLG